ncbi:MAG: response regulator transcription factor [Candidatus Omnitrophica bacterium]|nr:response regulator transcription factor [Candidatus Omnitrophota bacterium]
MPKEQILIIEDDKHIAKLVKYNAEKAGFDCTVIGDGEEALNVLNKHGADLVILDIMLPKMDGLEVCRAIRQSTKLREIPVIMLTAKGAEVDRVVGLELGADDYVVKPFSPRELMLRIKAILRRGKTEELPKEVIKRGSLVIDIPKHKVMVSNKEVELTPIEFKLLVTLIERAGRIQSRDKLLSDVWDMHSDVFTRTVDTHIKRLREKLGKMGDIIETERGLGYRCKEDED